MEKELKIGFCICGSFCTIKKAIAQMENLAKKGHKIIPIMSKIAYKTDTRFGTAKELINKVENICGRKIIKTIEEAEPIGPNKLTDIMVIAPCTSNTLSKLEKSTTDTTVTMAAKSHLRQEKPIVIALASNDSLSGTAKILGSMLNRKNYFFVPMKQDDIKNKPSSLVAQFSDIEKTIKNAQERKQTRPIFLE